MAFATAEDVAARLGRALTDTETTQVEADLTAATAIIADAASKSEAWAATYAAPEIIKFLAVRVVIRAMANPQAFGSTTEQLGAYSYTQRFRDQGGDLLLTKAEQLLASRAINGSNSGTARLESQMEDVWDWRYGS